MKLRPDEITGLIKQQIKDYRSKLVLDDVGAVCTVGDGISRVHGIEKCMSGELLEFCNGTYGMAMNLSPRVQASREQARSCLCLSATQCSAES